MQISDLDPAGCPEINCISNELWWPAKGGGLHLVGRYPSVDEAWDAANQLLESFKEIPDAD
jgi:hypothetical protein